MADSDIKTVKQSENSPNKPWQFQPGQSGNPKGRPPLGTSLTELMRQFLDIIPPGQELSYKDAFVRKVYKLAMEDGSESSIRLIWNYIDGMPLQGIDMTSKGEKIKLLDVDAVLMKIYGQPDERSISEVS